MTPILSAHLLAAISATPVGYFMKVMKEHNKGPDSKGSTFYDEQNYWTLIDAAQNKLIDLYVPIEGGLPICTYIKLALPGMVGVIGLDHLRGTDRVQLLDLKDTVGSEGGGVFPYIHEEPSFLSRLGHADFSVAIVGPGDAMDGDGIPIPILWTIHPGHTCPMPKSANDASLAGKWVTVTEAKSLNFTAAKVIPTSEY